MTIKISMHAARTALNRDAGLRDWAEAWMKNKEREIFMRQPDATEETFKKYWLYVRPERMHEGAIEVVTAYREQHADK